MGMVTLVHTHLHTTLVQRGHEELLPIRVEVSVLAAEVFGQVQQHLLLRRILGVG